MKSAPRVARTSVTGEPDMLMLVLMHNYCKYSKSFKKENDIYAMPGISFLALVGYNLMKKGRR